MNKSLFSLPIVLLVFFLATIMARPIARKAYSNTPVTPIQNTSDPMVINAGLNAVLEYDKTTTYHLEFISVVNGTTMSIYNQGNIQTKWNLQIVAKNCSEPGNTDNYGAAIDEFLVHDPCWPIVPVGCTPPKHYYVLGWFGKLSAV